MTRKNKSGFVRNDAEGKPRFDLIPAFNLERQALLYGKGADKFGERNWEKANSEEDIASFKQSAFRHFIQYLNGAEDEDHFAATIWNLNGIEHVKKQLNNKK